jgi:hypothetical protein
MTKQSPFQESTHGHVDDHRGSYPYKNIGGMPINNPYNNLSHPKLETICDHLVRVFKHYKKPYWTNVTLFYPSQLPNDMDIIKDCTTALMEAKFTSHYLVATEAGTENNRYHHHVFIYAGSFEQLGKVKKKLKKVWGEILFSRFSNIFEECATCDAFDTAHAYEDDAGRKYNIGKMFRDDVFNKAWEATSPKSTFGIEQDEYDEQVNTEENYSKLVRTYYPKFDKFEESQWGEKALYHLSYICKKNNSDLPPLPLRRHPKPEGKGKHNKLFKIKDLLMVFQGLKTEF